MTRAILALALFSSLVFAQDGQSSGALEDFPTIINDLSSTYDTAPTSNPLPVYPTNTVIYPTATVEPAPTYGAPAPYPSSSGTSDQAPVPTSEAPPVYGSPSAPAPTYAPVPTIATSYGAPAPSQPVVVPPANGTVSEAPVPTASQTFVSAGNTFTVKLPVVLGAMALVFAML